MMNSRTIKRQIAVGTAILILLTTRLDAQSREVISFALESETYMLRGEIRKPILKEEKMVPAILFLVGSGEEASIKRYRVFTDFFLESAAQLSNSAIVYFDKRGVGLSDGNWYQTSFQQRALDAKNVAEHIKKYPFIDPERIYLVGHSQGGWIVQICLALYPESFAGGVSMAGPTFSVREQIINSYQSDLICSEKYNAKKAYAIAKRKTKQMTVGITSEGGSENVNQKQLRIIIDFDPEDYLKQIKRPLLLMWARNDKLVNVDRCISRLNDLFETKWPPHFNTYVAEGENHSFQKSDFCNSKPPKELVFSEESRKYLMNWLVINLYHDH